MVHLLFCPVDGTDIISIGSLKLQNGRQMLVFILSHFFLSLLPHKINLDSPSGEERNVMLKSKLWVYYVPNRPKVVCVCKKRSSYHFNVLMFCKYVLILHSLVYNRVLTLFCMYVYIHTMTFLTFHVFSTPYYSKSLSLTSCLCKSMFVCSAIVLIHYPKLTVQAYHETYMHYTNQLCPTNSRFQNDRAQPEDWQSHQGSLLRSPCVWTCLTLTSWPCATPPPCSQQDQRSDSGLLQSI